MEAVTTWLELVGALVVIAGGAVLVAPAVGVGVTLVLVGVALVGLSALITWQARPPKAQSPGSETA